MITIRHIWSSPQGQWKGPESLGFSQVLCEGCLGTKYFAWTWRGPWDCQKWEDWHYYNYYLGEVLKAPLIFYSQWKWFILAPKNILSNMFYLGPTLLLIVLRHFLIPCWNISIDYRALCINTHLYYRSASKITHLLSFHPAQHNGPSWILINFCNATQLNNLTCQHKFTQLICWFLKSELTSRNVHPCHLESVEVRRHLEPPAVRHQSMLKLDNWILSN